MGNRTGRPWDYLSMIPILRTLKVSDCLLTDSQDSASAFPYILWNAFPVPMPRTLLPRSTSKAPGIQIVHMDDESEPTGEDQCCYSDDLSQMTNAFKSKKTEHKQTLQRRNIHIERLYDNLGHRCVCYRCSASAFLHCIF